MKLLTLNTHSLIENSYEKKLADFISAIREIKPDIIALQEVNQSCSADTVIGRAAGYIPCQEAIPLKSDNHALKVCESLDSYNWTWLPIKIGYGKYDEGLALLSRERIGSIRYITLSPHDDYGDWKTRKALAINCRDEWFFNVHMGWWSDRIEGFSFEWSVLHKYCKKFKNVWLMGDFNNPAETKGEGYDLVRKSGFYDTFKLSRKKDDGYTVRGVIDGWETADPRQANLRIDQIWCDRERDILSSEVIFNGDNKPIVSDHYGVMISL